MGRGPFEILLESKESDGPKRNVELIEGDDEAANLPAIPDARSLRSSLGVTPKEVLDRVSGETTEGLGLEELLSRASQSAKFADELDKYDAVFYWRLGRDLVAAREQCPHGKWGHYLKSRHITDWKWNQAKVIFMTFPDPSQIADRTLTSLLTDAGVYKADRFAKAISSEGPGGTTSQIATGTSAPAPGTGAGNGAGSPISSTPGPPTAGAPSATTSSTKAPSPMRTSQGQAGDAKVKPEGAKVQVVVEPRTGKQEAQAEPKPATSAEDHHQALPASLPPDEAAPLPVDFRPPPPEFDLPLDLYEAVEWLRRASIWLSWVAEDSTPPGGEKYLSTHRRFLEVIDGWRHCRPHPASVARAG